MKQFCNWVVVAMLAVSCGGGDSEDKDENSNEESTGDVGQLVIDAVPLASAVPFEVQLSSPSTATGSNLTTGALETGGLTLTAESDASYIQKVEAAIQTIVSSEDCTPDLDLKFTTETSCFNQTVTSDGSSGTAVSDLIFFPDSLADQAIDGADPDSPKGKRILDDTAGIIAATEGDKPCISAVAENTTAAIAVSVDKAQRIAAALICTARKNAKQENLPQNIGDSIDLKEDVSSGWNLSNLSVGKAQIEKVASDGELPGLRTIVSVEFEDTDRQPSKFILDMSVYRSSDAAGSSRGRMLIYDQRKREGSEAGPTPNITTLSYEVKDNTSKVLLRDTSFNFSVDMTKLVGSDGQIDYKKFTEENLSEFSSGNQAGGPTQAQFELNTLTGVGSVSFMRTPAINLDTREVASVFILSTEVGESGEVEGCGIAGHNDGIATESGEVKSSIDILGKACLANNSFGSFNFGNDLSASQFVSDFGFVQKQCWDSNGRTDNLRWAVAPGCGSSDFADEFDLVTTGEGSAAVKGPSLPAEISSEFSGLDYGIEWN